MSEKITPSEQVTRTTSTDFQRHIGKYIDIAKTGHVVLTSHGRDVLTLIPASEFHRLSEKKQQD